MSEYSLCDTSGSIWQSINWLNSANDWLISLFSILSKARLKDKIKCKINVIEELKD